MKFFIYAVLFVWFVAGPEIAPVYGREQGKGEEVTAVEDLMREHGVLRRVFLIYEEILRRIDAEQECPRDAVASSAGIVHRFIEEYHEKLEEEYLFPRFGKTRSYAGLAAVLKEQHAAGRRLTDEILDLSKSPDAKSSRRIAADMRLFLRQYRPHAAREDTVLFPALRNIVPSGEYDKLGDIFENRERLLFGNDGFEGVVRQVAKIEESLGIFDLERFTAHPMENERKEK